MSIYQTLKFIVNHPLNRDHQVSALKRFIKWQIGGRIVPGPVAVPFVNYSKLLVFPGMTGATGNVYAGLHEFEDMAFVLHLLRREDLFVDVGANVGSYTVLAGAAVGAHCVSFEPLPDAYRQLQLNICLNDIKERVQAFNLGVGRRPGVLRFTVGLDAQNHVATGEEAGGATLEVETTSLDDALGTALPKLIKIDVEGFETDVVAGAERIVTGSNLDAIIMELNGSSNRYGFDESALHQQLLGYGFDTFTYSPFDRVLMPLGGMISRFANTLYVRNIDRVRERLATSPKFHVLYHDI